MRLMLCSSSSTCCCEAANASWLADTISAISSDARPLLACVTSMRSSSPTAAHTPHATAAGDVGAHLRPVSCGGGDGQPDEAGAHEEYVQREQTGGEPHPGGVLAPVDGGGDLVRVRG